MKNKIISIGIISAIAAPSALLISCGDSTQKKLDKDQGLTISYWPDIDPAISLGAKIKTSAFSGGHSATWFTGTKFEDRIQNLIQNRPLWDVDTIDEEYWRNLNGGKPVGLVYEKWVETPQKGFLASDPNIVPIEFDYNSGIANEKYHWKVIGDENVNEVLLQNKGDVNYINTSDLYQIRDMGEILKKAASELDKAFDETKYSIKAKQVIEETNKHWSEFAKLQGSDVPIDENKHEWINDDIDKNQTLLIINIKTGAVSAGSNDTVAFSTPSIQKEAYTKTHFRMPNLNKEQFNILAKGNNLKNDGHAVVASATNNGVYFPNYEQNPLPQSFWSSWDNKIDKIVIGVSPSEVDNINIQTIISNYPFITNLMKGSNGLTSNNAVIMDTYLAGSGAYGFRMPIGQNVFIDKIAKAFYDVDVDSDVLKWDF
ncbi:hypothetical protein [Candidatus Mycoplasma mahonii]|uniref:hypothetical protein n=1 Tax=Candidatus Mycoplasma mahonii TaxID=3004105 RepID=UPI0026E9E34D|nr:hypothetical protein [Candidatus Mycoplasma mahonii]WKX02381.1 hypothetical protein O3I44_03220 [Candidatus Mycoplasma mahonii]